MCEPMWYMHINSPHNCSINFGIISLQRVIILDGRPGGIDHNYDPMVAIDIHNPNVVQIPFVSSSLMLHKWRAPIVALYEVVSLVW